MPAWHEGRVSGSVSASRPQFRHLDRRLSSLLPNSLFSGSARYPPLDPPSLARPPGPLGMTRLQITRKTGNFLEAPSHMRVNSRPLFWERPTDSNPIPAKRVDETDSVEPRLVDVDRHRTLLLLSAKLHILSHRLLPQPCVLDQLDSAPEVLSLPAVLTRLGLRVGPYQAGIPLRSAKASAAPNTTAAATNITHGVDRFGLVVVEGAIVSGQ